MRGGAGQTGCVGGGGGVRDVRRHEPEFQPVALRLATHLDAVIAGHQHDVPLGLVEAINSKIAALRHQARGYRDPEYFKLKIFQRCSLPDNPWAQIVL